MSKPQSFLSEAKEATAATLGPALKKNANLLTAFAAILILLGGAGFVNGNSAWLLTVGFLAGAFLVFFLYLNFRGVLKAALAAVLTAFAANFALQGGFLLDPLSGVGLVWMSAQVFLFLATISLSYLFLGHRSRWTAAILAQAAMLMATAVTSAGLPPLPSVGVGLVVGAVVFLFYYRWIGVLLAQAKRMPEVVASETAATAIKEHCEREGWSHRLLTPRRGPASFLVWNGEVALVLLPVKLDTRFAVSPSRRGVKLLHRGASINSWLITLVGKSLPVWRSRNAPMMLVLLDSTSKNGLQPETIGVALPDTTRRLPVGIYPAKGMLQGPGKRSQGVLEDMASTYGPYLRGLSERQLKALEDIGRKQAEESEANLTPAR